MESHEPCLHQRWTRLLCCCAVLALCGTSAVLPTATAAVWGDMILNEYNAVSSGRYLGSGGYSSNDGVGANDGGLRQDLHFASILDLADDGLNNDSNNGRIEGNGGNWIELVVTGDHLDVRGWELRWAETGADGTDGTGIWYPDADNISTTVEQGIIKFSNDALWADLRAGTMITISERDSIPIDTDFNNDTQPDRNFTNNLDPGEADYTIDLSTNRSYNPVGGDWNIHVSTRGERGQADPLIETLTNVNGDMSGDFSVGPDDWELSIYDGSGANGNLVFGPIGEDIRAFGNFPGGIINEEVARLEADPARGVTNDQFDDATRISTFGLPNQYTDAGLPVTQDFSGLYPTIVTLTSNVSGFGEWHNASTWSPAEVPRADYDTVVVDSHLIAVNTPDAVASSLKVDGGDKDATLYLAGGTLTIAHDVEIKSKVLMFLPGGHLDVGGAFSMRPDTEFKFFLDNSMLAPGAPAMVEVAGAVTLPDVEATDAALKMETYLLDGPLGSLDPLDPGWGKKPLTIIHSESGQLEGTFETIPDIGHLNHGVFFQGLSYPPGSGDVVVDLFQAAPGDANGDALVNFDDLVSLLASGKWNKQEPAIWTEGDWDRSGYIDFGDIMALLETGLWNKGSYSDLAKAEVGGNSDTAAVPEPGTAVMLLSAALLLLLAIRRRRAG